MTQIYIHSSPKDFSWKQQLQQLCNIFSKDFTDYSSPDTSDFVLLLLSPSYFDDVFTETSQKLLQKCMNNGVSIISILISDCDWNEVSIIAQSTFYPRDLIALDSKTKDEANEILQDLLWEMEQHITSAPLEDFAPNYPQAPFSSPSFKDDKPTFRGDIFSDNFSADDLDFALPSSPAPEPPPRRSIDFSSADSVEFSVFTSKGITPNSKFIVDVWAYLPEQLQSITENLKAVGRDNKLGGKAGVPVPNGTVVGITLSIDSLEVTEPVDSLIWLGSPSNASFNVNIPKETELGDYSGKAVISYQGINIAKILFLVSITADSKSEYSNQSSQIQHYQSAFASYSSKDRSAVLARLQGIKTIAPNLDIFLDVLSLRAGDNWLEKLEENIDGREKFYLFWSKSAAESKWVKKEWQMALQKKGLDYIHPIPLDEPSIAPPPSELSSLHFADAYLVYIKHYQQ